MPTIGIPIHISELVRSPMVVLISVGDSLACGLTDVVSRLNETNIPLHLIDVASVVVSSTANDIQSLTLTEQASIASTGQSVSDSLLIGANDVGQDNPPVAIHTTESLLTTVSDATPSLNTTVASTAFIAATDTILLGCSDGQPPEFLSVAASDTLSVSIDAGIFGEETSVFGFTPQQFVSVSVIDTCVVRVITPTFPTTPISAVDMISLQVVEPPDSSQNVQSAEALTIQTAESTPAIVLTASLLTVNASDACQVVIADDTPAVTASLLTPTDSSAYTGDDQASLIALASSSDLLSVPVFDIASVAVSANATETCSVQANEISIANVVVATSDACTMQASESAAILSPILVSTVDSTTLAMTETPLINAMTLASEVLAIPTNEAASLLLKFLLVTDSLGIGTTEASSLFTTFIQLAVSDSATIQAGDLITVLSQLLTQLSTIESLQLGQNDTLNTLAATMGLSDTTVLGLTETTIADLLRSYLTSDSVAYQINAEDANVINPFVVNVFINVDDQVTSDVGEVTGGRPSTLTVYADDDSTAVLSELALKDIVPLLETLDFEIATSYQAVSDPQSFQTVSSNFW